MASVNKIILVGGVVRDPELRHTANGKPVVQITLATSDKRTDKNTGEKVEDSQYHRVTFYDKLAEVVAQYVVKGSSIYVEGKVKYSKFRNKEGFEQNATDISAFEMKILRTPDNGHRESPKASKPSSGFDDMDAPF